MYKLPFFEKGKKKGSSSSSSSAVNAPDSGSSSDADTDVSSASDLSPRSKKVASDDADEFLMNDPDHVGELHSLLARSSNALSQSEQNLKDEKNAKKKERRKADCKEMASGMTSRSGGNQPVFLKGTVEGATSSTSNTGGGMSSSLAAAPRRAAGTKSKAGRAGEQQKTKSVKSEKGQDGAPSSLVFPIVKDSHSALTSASLGDGSGSGYMNKSPLEAGVKSKAQQVADKMSSSKGAETGGCRQPK